LKREELRFNHRKTAEIDKSRMNIEAPMGKGSSKAARDNRANQMNPKSPAYAASRSSTKAANDNRADQLNPNSEAFRTSRNPVQPSEQSKNEYPGALVDYASPPDLQGGTPPAPSSKKKEEDED
jgi:hypothetical protein